MKRITVGKEDCLNCPHADRTVSYSAWHYCNHPTDHRQFKVIRTIDEFTPTSLRATPPAWCPKRLTREGLKELGFRIHLTGRTHHVRYKGEFVAKGWTQRIDRSYHLGQAIKSAEKFIHEKGITV